MLLGVLLLGGLVALVATGVFTVGGLTLADRLDPVRIYSFGLARMIRSDDDSRPDIVGVTRNSDETTRLVYVDFDAKVYRRWESEPLGDGADYIYNPLLADGSAVYFSFKTTLAAFSRDDGRLRWESSLSDEISNICQDCLAVMGDRVIALTADGVLSSFDVRSGDQAWQVRLETTPRQLLDLAGRVGVPDEGADGFGISIYEPAGGALAGRIVPECPNEVFDDPQTLGIYDPVLLSADKLHLYIPIADFRPGCLQKWDAASWAMLWQAVVPEEAVDSLEPEQVLLAERALYTSDGHTLHEISLADGAHREVANDEDHNLAPSLVRDGVLVALAERTRGTRQHVLWGIDNRTGTRRWEFDPAAQELDEGGSNVVHDDGLWSVAYSEGLIVVLEAFSDPNTLVLTALKPADGSVSSLQTLEYGDDDSSHWIQVLGWEGERVYLETGGRLRVIDWLSGSETARWP